VAVIQYMNALQSYQDDVKLIQDQFRSAMDLYRAQANLYTAQMEDYQTARVSYEGARAEAVNSAEAMIEANIAVMGWTFVDTRDLTILTNWITKTWTAQIIIIAVYFGLILVFIKRKDASA
jgi:hypothetical protein